MAAFMGNNIHIGACSIKVGKYKGGPVSVSYTHLPPYVTTLRQGMKEIQGTQVPFAAVSYTQLIQQVPGEAHRNSTYYQKAHQQVSKCLHIILLSPPAPACRCV